MRVKNFIFLLILGILLIGCGKKDEGKEVVSTNENGVLKVGMDLSYPPFETVDTEGNPTGISVDIAEALGKHLGRDVEIKNIAFGSLIPALEGRDIDIIIGSMSITEEREKKVDFTKPYNYFKVIALGNKKYMEKNNYTKDTTWDEIFKNKDTRFVGLASQISANIPISKGFNVKEATEKSSAILQVAQGEGDLLIMSTQLIVDAQRANPDTTEVVWDTVESSPVGMAVLEGNTKLRDQANEFIDQLESSGFNNKMKAKYNDIINEDLGDDIGYDYYTTK